MTLQDESIARRALKVVEDSVIRSIRSVCSVDPHQRVLAIRDVYQTFGAPFGSELKAALLWYRYEQCTTVN